MAAQMEIEFNSDGFRQILMSGEVQSMVLSKCNEVKARADGMIDGESEGFKVNVQAGGYGGGRWVGHVYTTDHESMVAQSEHQALLRALK